MGQRQLLASAHLPKKISGTTREEMEALGFQFGADVDDLFVECVLPAGWTKKADGNAYWSYLIDPGGVQRVSIFYKAAFYDRKASALWRSDERIAEDARLVEEG